MSELNHQLASLNPFFVEDASRIIRDRFMDNETLSWAANCGFQEAFGYVLVSSNRIFVIRFLNHGGKRIRYVKDTINAIFGGYSEERGIILPPNSPLPKSALAKRIVIEQQLNKITGVNRQDYEVDDRGIREILVIIETTPPIGSPILYTKQDGQFLYKLLSECSQITTPKTGEIDSLALDPDFSSLLEALAKLHKAGIISTDEFEAKKRDILAKL